MIISCNRCFIKFEINSDLIPPEGRLLQCSKCNNQWFFKKDKSQVDLPTILDKDNTDISDNLTKDSSSDKNKEITVDKIKPTNMENKDIEIKKIDVLEDKKNDIKKFKTKSQINILNFIIIFIISIISLIILTDTFKSPISLAIPNIEFLLYNLYESVKDILLFFKDLV